MRRISDEKFLFILGLAFVCENIHVKGFFGGFYRCENDEVVCYVYSGRYDGGISCKFKENTDE